MKEKLVIGTRGSKLALKQANWVKARLNLIHPSLSVRVEIIKTTGDIRSDPLSVIGGKGVFTKELEEALLAGSIDIAVHSLKDLPTLVPESLTIAAICEREDPRDALVVSRELDFAGTPTIAGLPQRAVIGTSSQRRLAQLKHLRKDLVIKELRGNVDTRLRKLDAGQYDGLILAAAGLRRLGLEDRIGAPISADEILPAVGQGAIAIESRADATNTIELVKHLEHPPTRVACTAERALLRALGGGCQLPIAAHAVVFYDKLKLEGLVAAPDGNQIIRNTQSGNMTEADELGETLAERLLKQGAKSLLASYLK